MCHKHKCQRNRIVDFSTVIYQHFQPCNNQRQEYQTIQPHRVNQLNDSVCHHAIQRGEQQRMQTADFSAFLQKITKCNRSCTQLTKLHNQQAGKHPFFRQQHHDQGKWTGKIIADNTHKVAGKVPRPVVEDTAISPKGVSQRFKIIDILPVQVETENRFFAEWGNPKECIGKIGQCNRNKKCNQIKLVANHPALQTMPNTGEGQR